MNLTSGPVFLTSRHPNTPQPHQRIIYTTHLILHKNYFKVFSIFSVFIYLICPFLKPFQNQSHALNLSESSIPSTTLCTYWAIKMFSGQHLPSPCHFVTLCPFPLLFLWYLLPPHPQAETPPYTVSVVPNWVQKRALCTSTKNMNKELLLHPEAVKFLK